MEENKAIKKSKKFMNEFKTFIMRGNIIDMAVGVIMGTAFSKIVSSLVSDIFMPLVGIIGGKDFSEFSITVNGSVITYGAFIQNIIDFLIIATCLFVFIKFISKLSFKKKVDKEKAVEEAPPAKSDEVLLLEEIRDLLKDK